MALYVCVEQDYIAVSARDNTKKAWNTLNNVRRRLLELRTNMVLKVDIEMIENHLISTIDTIQVATMLE